ncbi:MAG: exodeoxyribonuclease V subunit alpha [Victivallales bacterium]|nr:exodeoxyribonuclease V subunit alpha [Victivallales bacterium]
MKYENYKSSNEFIPLDWQFADMIVRRSDGDDDLRLLAAMALCAVRNSHSCLDLIAWSSRPTDSEDYLPSPLSPEDWLTVAERHPSAVSQDALSSAPLILDAEHKLLYLNRYRRYEESIAKAIRSRIAASESTAPFSQQLINDVHSTCRYFTKPFGEDLQQQAVATAVTSDFAIITGGPGTGKTTVLTVILAIELQRNPQCQITLCAPTGKAAARMKESIARELAADGSLAIADDAIRQSLAAITPQTLHAVLGISPETGIAYRNRQNPLETELVVVDECSMSSLELVHQLLESLPPTARLILLGDQNQLASVESGVVFAELCDCPSLRPHVCRLTENHRSKTNKPLCDFVNQMILENQDQLSKTMEGMVQNLYNSQDGNQFQTIHLRHDQKRHEALKLALKDLLETISTESVDFHHWNSPKSVEEAFSYSLQFKILCAVREGDYGILTINSLMHDLLNMEGPYPDGLPLLVTQNDPVTGLRNGDVGICFQGKVHFPVADGPKPFRDFAPVQLPPYEDAFAMTIHKSQGSDYPVVLMVLPNHDNPIMTRELVYTGITRTKKSFFLIAEPDDTILKTAILRKTQRWSGLKYLL